jgi:rare lipoprotein A (peptidoglycan hydrolase)
LASQDFINQVNDMPPSAFSSPEGIERIREQARQAARSEPTRELQAAKYQEYTKAIEARKKAAEDFTPGVKQDIDRALLQDIGLPAVKALVDKAAKKGGGGLFQSMIQSGADPASAAASALGGSAVAAFTTRVQNLYLRNVEATINDWREKNPGRALVPASKNVLISQAIAETRQSKEYAQAYTELTGRKPGEAGPGKVGTSVGPREAGPAQTPNGYPKRSAAGIPDREVRDYQQRALMTGDWLRSEVEAINDGKPVSPETYNLAKRAGTSVNRLLLEQLKLYPELDSGGGAQKYLQEQVRRQRQGQTVSSANYQGAVNQDRAAAPYNPLAPGSWLMNMLMPPAAAATLPPGYARFQGGGGGGGPIDPGQWASGPAVRGSNAETGGGYTIPGMKDAQGRPPVFSQGGANSFAAMVRDSGGQVKAGDIASSQRSAGKNRAVGGAEGSHHLEGNAMDIHGSSIDWIRKNGARYGWHVNDYPGSHGGHVEFRGGGTASPQASTRKGGGMTGLATYYNGSGGSDGVAGGPTANGEKYNPSAMTAAVQWSLRDKYLNKWVQVEDLNRGKRVRVWVNDVGQMGGSEKSVNQADPRMIDLSPAAFTKLFGSTSRGVGRIRIVEG